MSDATQETKAQGRSALPLLVGGALAVALGGGAFYAVYSGTVALPFTSAPPPAETEAPAETGMQPTFVPLEEIMVSLPRTAPARHLRFQATLEVARGHQSEITAMLPRIMDVINTYLRATEVSDIREPAAFLRIRAQLLRRIQTVTPAGSVRDLLVTQFLIN